MLMVLNEEVLEHFGMDSSDSDSEKQRLRLTDSLAASYPSANLSKALEDVKGASALEDNDPLSRSCFASLRNSPHDSEDDLCSFDWLLNCQPLEAPIDKEVSDSENQQVKEEPVESNRWTSALDNFHKFPSDYNPKKHIDTKPPYSFSCLIFMAIESSPQKSLPVKGIYKWIEDNFPFYRYSNNGWKNSIRHNLSLNKSFTKIVKDDNMSTDEYTEDDEGLSKGSLWTVDHIARSGMLQALKRTPYHPYAQIQMYSTAGALYAKGGANHKEFSSVGRSNSVLYTGSQVVPASASPHIFFKGLYAPLQGDSTKKQSGVLGVPLVNRQEKETEKVTPAKEEKKARPGTPPLSHYHPNINSFRGQRTPVKLAASKSYGISSFASSESMATIRSLIRDAAAQDSDSAENHRKKMPRKQALVPSATLYPYLSEKMRNLVQLIDMQDNSESEKSDDSDAELEELLKAKHELQQMLASGRKRKRKSILVSKTDNSRFQTKKFKLVKQNVSGLSTSQNSSQAPSVVSVKPVVEKEDTKVNEEATRTSDKSRTLYLLYKAALKARTMSTDEQKPDDVIKSAGIKCDDVTEEAKSLLSLALHASNHPPCRSISPVQDSPVFPTASTALRSLKAGGISAAEVSAQQ